MLWAYLWTWWRCAPTSPSSPTTPWWPAEVPPANNASMWVLSSVTAMNYHWWSVTLCPGLGEQYVYVNVTISECCLWIATSEQWNCVLAPVSSVSVWVSLSVITNYVCDSVLLESKPDALLHVKILQSWTYTHTTSGMPLLSASMNLLMSESFCTAYLWLYVS